MKILLIHNAYGKYSGEEAVVDAQIALLQAHGHTVYSYFRSSEELQSMKLGKVRSFFTGLYNYASIKDIKRKLKEVKPDIVHIHNLYPLISPSVLPVIRKAGVPIVMTVHNYRLLCPNGLFFTHNRVCEACVGKGKEWNCILKNCEKSLPKSIGYAIRNYWARLNKYYISNIDLFICLTDFQKRKLVKEGFSSDKLIVIPNFFNRKINSSLGPKSKFTYVCFAGRLTYEKGAEIIAETAFKLPKIKFKIAGQAADNLKIRFSENVDFLGHLNQEELKDFYQEASCLILPSIWYEGFPMVIPEAMNYGLPVIASAIGGIPEIIENNRTGLLFRPSDSTGLESAIQQLIDRPDFAKQLAENAYTKLQKEYSSEVFYARLIGIYNEVIKGKLNS